MVEHKIKRCPHGHKHLSWAPGYDEVFCWDCNRNYPFSECLGHRVNNAVATALKKEQRQYPRARIRWPVSMQTPQGPMEGATVNISPNGVFIRCWNPLRVNEVFDMVIVAPNRTLMARGEVAWSNSYGPLKGENPRGMGARFLSISEKDRRFIAKATLDYLKSEEIESQVLEKLHTLLIDSS